MTTLLASEHWGGGHGGWFLAPLIWISVWILIIVLVKSLIWRRRGPWHHYHGGENPFSVLAGRYARGEIDEQEYRQRLEVLRQRPK